MKKEMVLKFCITAQNWLKKNEFVVSVGRNTIFSYLKYICIYFEEDF